MKKILLLLAVCALSALADEKAADSSPAFNLRPGDVLNVTVFRVEEFSRQVRVDKDGTFQFPLCGEIQAGGRTSKEVARELEKRLKNQIANPQVDVYVSEWAQRTVYILGEVKSSMSKELPTYERMTALQAISAAGGFTENADLTRVIVLRRDSTGKKLVRLPVDVSALAGFAGGGDDFVLQPEDTLIVPKAQPVYMTGLINTKGIQPIDTQNPPLCSEFVVRCGGLLPGADMNNIRIIRQNKHGKPQILIASIMLKEDGSFVNDMRIQPGDYIIVAAAAQIQVFGEVANQGPLTLRPDEIITASQAITRAGGFKPAAKRSDIILIRGTKFLHLNLKKLYESEEGMAQDVTLQNGDIIFVKESLF